MPRCAYAEGITVVNVSLCAVYLRICLHICNSDFFKAAAYQVLGNYGTDTLWQYRLTKDLHPFRRLPIRRLSFGRLINYSSGVAMVTKWCFASLH